MYCSYLLVISGACLNLGLKFENFESPLDSRFRHPRYGRRCCGGFALPCIVLGKALTMHTRILIWPAISSDSHEKFITLQELSINNEKVDARNMELFMPCRSLDLVCSRSRNAPIIFQRHNFWRTKRHSQQFRVRSVWANLLCSYTFCIAQY
ncbi:hypothetical protein BT69DRAFT_564432 [Atractiella rhizophila]|nr:hypothetical protein BT69DRAFT_564432 [Atractiella rhizophila]